MFLQTVLSPHTISLTISPFHAGFIMTRPQNVNTVVVYYITSELHEMAFSYIYCNQIYLIKTFY